MPKTPPRMPCASDSPAIWRTTIRCVQPSAFSVPSSRTRLPTDESASSAASRNAATAAIDREREAEVVREVRRVDERAADLVGDVLRARDLRLRQRCLDLLLARCATSSSTRRAHEHDVREALLVRERLQLLQRQVDVGALTAERRADETDDRERRAVQVELRADLQRVLRGVGRRDERLACRRPAARKRPFVTCAVVTTPIVGCVWSTPPIVYAVVVMFVCGGFSTCCSVWLGAVKRARSCCRLRGQALRERRAVRAAAEPAAADRRRRRCRRRSRRCRCRRSPSSSPFSFCEARLHLPRTAPPSGAGCSAGSGTSSPPSSAVATIFGTTPSWCSARSVRPCVTCATPCDRRDLLRGRSAGRSAACPAGRSRGRNACRACRASRGR